jgi:hypothetical protein
MTPSKIQITTKDDVENNVRRLFRIIEARKTAGGQEERYVDFVLPAGMIRLMFFDPRKPKKSCGDATIILSTTRMNTVRKSKKNFARRGYSWRNIIRCR